MVGHFYGLNILGAGLGAIATGLVLIELLGLQGVTILAALVNFGVGISVLLALRSNGPNPAYVTASDEAPDREEERRRLPISCGAAAILFGFGTLALQIVFFRVLSSYFTLSTIVFPIVLCVYLLLMSLGQTLGGRLADRWPDRLPLVVAGLFAAGAILLLVALRFPPEWAGKIGVLAFTDFNGQLVSDKYPRLVGDPRPIVVILFSTFFMLAVVAWAALFPIMLRLVTADIRERE